MNSEQQPEFSAEQLEAIQVDIQNYEFRERVAMLQDNNENMHAKHVYHKAMKEIRYRVLRDRQTTKMGGVIYG